MKLNVLPYVSIFTAMEVEGAFIEVGFTSMEDAKYSSMEVGRIFQGSESKRKKLGDPSFPFSTRRDVLHQRVQACFPRI